MVASNHVKRGQCPFDLPLYLLEVGNGTRVPAHFCLPPALVLFHSAGPSLGKEPGIDVAVGRLCLELSPSGSYIDSLLEESVDVVEVSALQSLHHASDFSAADSSRL